MAAVLQMSFIGQMYAKFIIFFWTFIRRWPLYERNFGNDGKEAVTFFQTLLEIHHSFAVAGRSEMARKPVKES